VWTEQYVTRANIEAETTEAIARTMILPAGLRHLALIEAAEVPGMAEQTRSLVSALVSAIDKLAAANVYPDGLEGLELAEYARDHQLAAMDEVREAADKLEKVVADDLWPLPKYAEILFIK
jgi:glutamine synthetase